MARINLLPWRDELRQEKKKEFFNVLIGFAVLGLLCSYVWVSTVQNQIDDQAARNNLLDKEIKALEQQVVEIQDLKKRRAELLDRMKVIQDLQGTRSVIVRYFDEMVRAVPDGVYLTKLSRTGNQITIEGSAESLNRISTLMRGLVGSDWFENADVSKIGELKGSGAEIQAQNFIMTVDAVVLGSTAEGER